MDFVFGRDFNEPREALSAHHVMRVWRDHAQRELPWAAMPHDDRTGSMHLIVSALLDVSDGLYSDTRQHRIRAAAIAHGAFRRAQGCTERVILDDFNLLRLSLKLALYQVGTTTSSARRFIRLLLPDWRFARRGSTSAHLNGVLAPRDLQRRD